MLPIPTLHFDWNIFLALSFFPVILVLIKRFISRRPNTNRLPPGPPTWPILGNKLFPNPSQRMCDWSKKYGDTILLYLGARKMVAMHNVETVKKVFMEDAATGRDQENLLNIFLQGRGIQQAEGDLWREHRKFMTRALRDQGMGKSWLEDSVLAEVDILLKKIANLNCQPTYPKPFLAHTAANLVSAMATGRRYSHVDENFNAFANVFAKIMGCLESLGLVSRIRWFRYLPNFAKHWATYLAGWHLEIEFCRKQITEQETMWREHADGDGGFVSAFLDKAASDKAKKVASSSFNDEQLLFSLANLYSGGTETSTTTMLWSFLYMATYPEIQAKVHSEIDRVVRGNIPVRLEHRADLPFTDATLHEVQRCGSVAPIGLYHVTLDDMDIDGFEVQKGTLLTVNIGSIHRDPRYWKFPEEFYPEHFLDDKGRVSVPEAFMPFGVGKRMCPGAPLARMTLYLMFTNILKTFTIITNDPEASPNNFESSINRGPKPYKIQFIPRQPRTSIYIA